MIIRLLRLGVWQGDEGSENGAVKRAETDGTGKALQIEQFLNSKKPKHFGRLLSHFAHFRRCIGSMLDCSVGIVKSFQKELCIRQVDLIV